MASIDVLERSTKASRLQFHKPAALGNSSPDELKHPGAPRVGADRGGGLDPMEVWTSSIWDSARQLFEDIWGKRGRRQACWPTARSTTEAELMAFAGALFGETLHLHTIESKVDILFEQDNQATITVVKAGYSAKLLGANRVHRVNLGSVHELLELGVFNISYCTSESQRANSLTKVMPPMLWPEAISQLCICAP